MFKKTLQQGRSEAHGAMKKERHVCARRRDGEPAVSWARRNLFHPPPRAALAALSRWYAEPLCDARTKLEGFFNILLAPLPTVHHECHRPVVHQGHAHMRGKHTSFNQRPACPQISRDLFIEALG